MPKNSNFSYRTGMYGRIADTAVPVSVGGFLVFSALAMTLAPNFIDNASAVRSTSASGSVVAPTATHVGTTLGLSATSASIELNPNAAASVFGSDYSTVVVSTNNETGYKLSMADADGDNALKHQMIATDTPKIASVSADTLGSDLTNQWGYNYVVTESVKGAGTSNATNDKNVATSTFKQVPTTSSEILTTAEASRDTIQVNYGVGVNTAIPSGTYASSVVFTAVTNTVPANFFNIEYMDEMSHEICAKVNTPAAFVNGAVNTEVPQTVLKDRRDGATYTVRKLADGNCWMSENLKISKETATYPGMTGKDAGVLESTLTDMTSGTFELPDSQTEKTGAWEQPPTMAHIYKDTENTYYEDGLTKKVGAGGSPEYYQNNYYNFWAATLNSTNETYPNDAPSTICPKNWTLPANGDLSSKEESHGLAEEHTTASTSGFNSGDKNSYSFTNLAQVYRMSYTNHWNAINGADGTNNAAASARLRAMPLSFPLSGGYNINSGVVGQGSNGYWWSSTATSATNANGLAFDSSRVIPQNNSYRGYGFSVRCVAR